MVPQSNVPTVEMTVVFLSGKFNNTSNLLLTKSLIAHI